MKKIALTLGLLFYLNFSYAVDSSLLAVSTSNTGGSSGTSITQEYLDSLVQYTNYAYYSSKSYLNQMMGIINNWFESTNHVISQML